MNGQAALVGVVVGRYRVEALIGRGGMGDVYRARDLELDREVALKTLPVVWQQDERRVSRLLDEARLLAAISHPNIATLYGIEWNAGQPFLAMELVEGQTVRSWLAQPHRPRGNVLGWAIEIADALSTAHEKGIVHRDLKPANVMIRPDGHVKVLDFGLAASTDTASDLTASTLSAQGLLTSGLHGTPAYMSPQHVEGQPPDRQDDVWAFGCLLFEMLAGAPAFGRPTVDAVLLAVEHAEPDWTRLPASTPPEIVTAIKLCLRKDRRSRVHDLADVRLMLEERTPPQTSRVPQRILWVAVAAAFVLAAAGTLGVHAWLATERARVRPAQTRRLQIPLPDSARHATISPDGQRVAYIAGKQIWLHDIASGAARAVTDPTPGITTPVWAPDSHAIAYFTPQSVVRVRLPGGQNVVCSMPKTYLGLEGAAWSPSGLIVFAVMNDSLYEVSADGGELRERLALDKAAYYDFHNPTFLPDGQTILLGMHRISGETTLGVLEGSTLRTVAEAGQDEFDEPLFLPPAHLAFSRLSGSNAGVMISAFDLATRSMRGTPTLIAPLAQHASVGAGSLLVRQEGQPMRTVAWVDRTGQVLGTIGSPMLGLSWPAIAPDGQRVAVAAETVNGLDVWVLDGQTATKVTAEPPAMSPEWTPDGSLLYMTFPRGGSANMRLLKAADTGLGRPLGVGYRPVAATDGVLWYTPKTDVGLDIWRRPLSGEESAARLLARTPASEWSPYPSPDGRYVAFASDAQGGSEVFVRKADGTGDSVRISDRGGEWPVWRGREIFYPSHGAIMAVRVETDPFRVLGPPRQLFTAAQVGARWLTMFYDVDWTGQRFVVVQTPNEMSQKAMLIDGWESLVPE